MNDRTPAIIRPVRAGDATAIAGLLRSLGLFAHVNEEASAVTEERVAAQLERNAADDSHTVLVAEDPNGAVVGYIAAHWFPNLLRGADGYVSELFLCEAARGQGIGSALLDAVKAEAIERGVTRLMLFNLRKRESYQRRFYEKAGWNERDDIGLFMYDVPGW